MGEPKARGGVSIGAAARGVGVKTGAGVGSKFEACVTAAAAAKPCVDSGCFVYICTARASAGRRGESCLLSIDKEVTLGLVVISSAARSLAEAASRT